MFFSDSEKKFSSEYNNIFVPVSENEENSDKDKSETVNISDIVYPKYGEMFGELIIDDCAVDAPLFLGDNSVALRNGVGIYYGSCIPGYGKTILVAGHNSTFFNGLKNVEKGQSIVIKTSYGNYEYEITDLAVKQANDSSAYDLSADEENLILYTCYPFDELGLTSRRYFVYADYVSGPVIDKNAQEGD
ncbi:MAG: class D sortase [Acutalibacteraceae bacterium]|nr:class D sortase [Acutalibacteraceae bacterium]